MYCGQSIVDFQKEFCSLLEDSYDYDIQYIDKSSDSFILTLYNGVVFNNKIILSKRPYYSDNRYHWTCDVEVFPKPRETQIALKRIHKLKRIDETILFSFHKFQQNIYHSFLSDNSSYFNCLLARDKNLHFSKIGNFADTPINKEIYSEFFNKPILPLSSFAFDKLIIINSGMSTFINNDTLSEHIKILRRKFLINNQTNRYNIFTYRTRGGRLLTNLRQVKGYAIKAGYIPISDNRLLEISLYDQASLYNACNKIFSIHDASLYNLIYCRPGTKVTVMEPAYKQFEYNENMFERVCDILDLEYCPVLLSHPDQSRDNWRDLSYNIDYLNCSL